MAVPMINVGIGKSAFNGCGFEARITTMLSIDKGAMNIPANKRALLRTNKGFISAFVISILLCAESTNVLKSPMLRGIGPPLKNDLTRNFGGFFGSSV